MITCVSYYQNAMKLQEHNGLLAGIKYMRQNCSPGDYLSYLIDRAQWVVNRYEQVADGYQLRGLNNLTQYMQADLPDGIYNFQVATGIEGFCMRIIDHGIAEGWVK